MISSESFNVIGYKPLVPDNHLESTGGTEHPWNYDYSLIYSKEWTDLGNYKLLRLESPEYLDYQFVASLCDLTNSGYEIESVTLIADQSDEQAFVAQVDLLQKKHGNFVHQAKWKPKNQRGQLEFEPPKVVAQRELVRASLKLKRYRAQYAPNVKLLPLWHAFKTSDLKRLGKSSFDDLVFNDDGGLGKGYYGKTSAIAAYKEVEAEDHEVILMLSWYAGKVVYPAISQDEQKLSGQPHYANHDLHYRNCLGFSEAVVFDAGQVLPRYLITLKKIGSLNTGTMDHLFNQTFRPSKVSLLFKPNFSHTMALLANNSFNATQRWLEQQQFTEEIKRTEFTQIESISNFLEDQTKEILLITIAKNVDPQILAKFIEMFVWNDEQKGLIPLNLDLNLTIFQSGTLVERHLSGILSKKAISDLKLHQKFAFIITGYQKDLHRLLIKDHYINSPNGFKGKVMVIIPEGSLIADENYYLYSRFGSLKQQAARFVNQHLDIHADLLIRQIKQWLILNSNKAVTPKELYFSKAQGNGLYSPGGALKPWEYSNELIYSEHWQDKGGFQLHKIDAGDPDYDFVSRAYQKSPMCDYELDEVYVISDQGAEQAFIAHLNILERHSKISEYQGDWQQEGHQELRQAIMNTLDQNSYSSLLSDEVKLLPLWHGTGPAAAAGIAKSGFASLALVDCGYFGKGLYGSSSAEYSYRVYARGFGPNQEGKNPGYGDNGLLLLSWYAGQNIFPVVKCDIEQCSQHPRELKDKLQGKSNYKNYDSHFVHVSPEDRKKHQIGLEDKYYPIIASIEEGIYQEFVTFATAQVLPRYILSLRGVTSKNHLPGMQAFLNTAEASFCTRNLYKKSILYTVAMLKNSAALEREQDYLLLEGLSLYVPCYGCNNEPTETTSEQYLLLDHARELINSMEQDLWLLRGNSGSGKSLFGRYLEQLLWEEHREGDLIPLFVPLTRMGDLSTIEDVIISILELKGLVLENILELKDNRKFLFILDGYDELPKKTKLLQKYDFNQKHGWQGKIIISFRAQFLDVGEESVLYPPHTQETLYQVRTRLMKSYIMPFKPQQINQYIIGFCKSSFNTKNLQPIDYQNKIDEFYEIKELIKEPFLLFLALNALPSFGSLSRAKIKKIDLYKAFTDNWFDNQFEKVLQSSNLSFSHSQILTIFDEYAKDLAFTMFMHDTQTVKCPENSAADQTFAKFFNDNKKAALGFQGSPLKKLGNTYFFIHKSFQEYFVAKKILDQLHSSSQELTTSLQQRLITNPVILDFIAGDLNKELRTLLFDIIYQTRKHPELHTSAANSITILNTARVSFTNLDLTNINITGAVLTQGIFDGTNFTNSNLTAVNFSGSWLANANFTNANMQGVEFGEKAFLTQENAAECCARSKDYFVVADWNEIKLYNRQFAVKLQLNHSSLVAAIALSANSEWLVVGDNNKHIKIWLTTSGEELKVVDGNAFALSFSLDNRWLAIGGYNSIKLLDTSNFKLQHTFTGIAGEVGTLSFSENSKLLISGHEDQRVALWSMANLKLISLLSGHKGTIKSVAFSPCGRFIVAGSLDKNINFWDVNTLELVKNIKFPSEICSIDFNPVKTHVLAIGFKNKLIVLWDLDQNNLIKQFTGHNGTVNRALFSIDGKQLISISEDKTIRRWAIDYFFKPSVYQHSSPLNSLQLFNSTTLIAKSDFICSYWSLIEGQLLNVETKITEHNSIVTSESKDLYAKSEQSLIKVYNKKHELQMILKGHNKKITAITFIHGNQLVSCSLDKSIKVWNTVGKNILTLNHQPVMTSILFVVANNLLITGSEDGYIYCWQPNNKLQLLWSSCQNVLCLERANVTKALSLSSDNIELLKQHRSIGSALVPIDDNEPALHIAAATGNLKLLLDLLIKADIDERSLSGKSALFWAAQSGHLEIVENLLNHGAAINIADNDGRTPLYISAKNGHLMVVEYLVEHKADVNVATTNDEVTPLMIASQNDHDEIVEHLVEHNAAVNAATNDGTTPLMIASSSGYREVAKYLVEHNAAVNVTDNGGWTSLMIAANNGHIQLVEYLLEHNAEVNAVNHDGWMPLMIAARKGYCEIVDHLLEHNAKVNAAANEGWTPLYLAAQNGHCEVVQCLLEHSAEVNAAENEGWTSLHVAAENGHEQVVTLLIENCAAIDLIAHKNTKVFNVSRKNQAILKLIVNQKLQNLAEKIFPTTLTTKQLFINLIKEQAPFEQLIDFIIKKQGNLNETEQDQITLLMMAAALQNYEATKKLIIAGADKNKTDDHATALHYACAYGPPEILNLLLEQNCNPNIPDSVGDYPELWAIKKDNLATLKILISFKRNDNPIIDINRIQGSTGKNLLEMAKHYDATQCIAYLCQLEEQKICEKISILNWQNQLTTNTSIPILFSQQLQLQHPSATIETLSNILTHAKQQQEEGILLQDPKYYGHVHKL